MTVTLRQIAQEVGLNVATVSRILNNPAAAKVSPATMQRVRQRAQQMGYRVNSAAQALARGRSGVVGVVLPDLNESIHARYLEVLTGLLHQRGLHPVPIITGPTAMLQRKSLTVIGNGLIDGAICYNFQSANRKTYEKIVEAGHPLVFVDCDDTGRSEPFSCVRIASHQRYTMLLSHFAERGYRRIGILHATGQARREASRFRSIYDAAGLNYDDDLLMDCHADADDNSRLAQVIHGRGAQRVDGLIVRTDHHLLTARIALAQGGVHVPNEMGLAALEDSQLCQYAETPITACASPINAVCDAAIQLYLRAFDASQHASAAVPAPTLIPRASTARYDGASSTR